MRNIPGLTSDLANRAIALSAKAKDARTAAPGMVPPAASIAPAKLKDGVATLRLYDYIDSDGGYWGISADEFAQALDDVDGQVDRIELLINSGGGAVWDGLAILNTLRSHGAPVTARVDGVAASAASFIAVACDEVVMMPNSRMMIHDALGICLGQAADMRGYADFLDETSDNIAAIYAERAGGTTEEWREVMTAKGLLGQWYTAEEALEAGLIDRVWTTQSGEDDRAPANTCACGSNGTPAGPGMAHKDECPDTETSAAPPKAPVDEYEAKAMARRAAEAALRHGLPA